MISYLLNKIFNKNYGHKKVDLFFIFFNIFVNLNIVSLFIHNDKTYWLFCLHKCFIQGITLYLLSNIFDIVKITKYKKLKKIKFNKKYYNLFLIKMLNFFNKKSVKFLILKILKISIFKVQKNPHWVAGKFDEKNAFFNFVITYLLNKIFDRNYEHKNMIYFFIIFVIFINFSILLILTILVFY